MEGIPTVDTEALAMPYIPNCILYPNRILVVQHQGGRQVNNTSECTWFAPLNANYDFSDSYLSPDSGI